MQQGFPLNSSDACPDVEMIVEIFIPAFGGIRWRLPCKCFHLFADECALAMVTFLVLRARLVNGHKSYWFFAALDAIQDGKPCAWDCDTF